MDKYDFARHIKSNITQHKAAAVEALESLMATRKVGAWSAAYHRSVIWANCTAVEEYQKTLDNMGITDADLEECERQG